MASISVAALDFSTACNGFMRDVYAADPRLTGPEPVAQDAREQILAAVIFTMLLEGYSDGG